MSELQQKINQAKQQLENIKKEIQELKGFKSDRSIKETIQQRGIGAGRGSTASTGDETINTAAAAALQRSLLQLRCRRTLQGHFGKVYATHWSGDSIHLVSASQDGKLMIWNGLTTNKVQSIPLTSSWVITCAFEQQANRMVACGGMDNICSIYQVERQSAANRVVRVSMELTGHRGYLSSCCFVDENQVVTSSGDGTCNVWDIQKNRPISTFTEHTSDVMSCAVSKSDPHIFASGSCDTTAKVWDIRTGKSVATFRHHTSDINSIAFFPDGNAIGTGSDDHTCHLMDIRAAQSLGSYGNDKILCGITSVSFSQSGRFLFGAYEDSLIRAWDILQDRAVPALQLSAHESRVSSVAVSPDGHCLLSGSWDTFLRIWA